MTEENAPRRVLLAVTETSPVERLWQSLVEHIADTQAEIVTLFISDDRWRRAASLPFTREISRVSGSQSEFTKNRAEQVGTDAVGRARRHLEKLAEGTEVHIAFEVISHDETEGVRRLVSIERDVLIAPSALERLPVFSELARRHRRVVLVEVDTQ